MACVAVIITAPGNNPLCPRESVPRCQTAGRAGLGSSAPGVCAAGERRAAAARCAPCHRNARVQVCEARVESSGDLGDREIRRVGRVLEHRERRESLKNRVSPRSLRRRSGGRRGRGGGDRGRGCGNTGDAEQGKASTTHSKRQELAPDGWGGRFATANGPSLPRQSTRQMLGEHRANACGRTQLTLHVE